MGKFSMVPLARAARLLSGGTPSKAEPSFWSGSIPWLTPKDMGQWDGSTEETVSREAIGNGTRLAPEGATYIAVRGMSLHNEIRIVRSSAALTFNQDIKAIVPNDGFEGRFLYYALTAKKPELLESVEAAGHGTGRLPTDRLESIEVPSISAAEQTAIASCLGAFDDQIELNRRMNETLEALAGAIFKDWFVDFGPTRAKMEGRPPYLAPALWALFPDQLDGDDRPIGWRQRPIHGIAEFVNGAAYKDIHFSPERDGFPVIKIAELKAGVTRTTKYSATDLGEKYRIDSGEILFSWSGNPDTSLDTFIWVGGPAWLNQHIFRVRENESASRAMIYFQLKALNSTFSEIARDKQTTGLGHVTAADMKRLMVCDPPIPVARAFDEIAGPMFQRTVANQLECHALAGTRDLLLPKLMSGEIRVSEVEAVAKQAAL